ncbi:MAG: glycosyltransferase family 2 protein [Eubacteriales bacterium]|nr:glycosyltransferase family 2 protein [Eubacteriales bacterium]
MAEISIMMAAYNAEAYIRRALDSILASTFADFDIIVVDDGSKDRTGAIADEYAGRDSRVHVLHQPNSGVCVTRNNAIDWAYEHSDSDWIIFIDSDDWIHPEMLERLLKAATDNGVHISACGYVETTGESPVIDPADLVPQVWEPMKFYQADYVNAIMTCCKLYHKDCYRTVRHPTDNYFDDEFVSYKMLYAEEKMTVIPAPLYCYFINSTGLTKNTWSPKLLDAWVAYEEQIAFFKEKGREDLVNFRYRGYLENAMVNYHAAQQAGDSPEMAAARAKIDKRIKQLLRRMWRQGCIQFWIDYDILYTFYPLLTRGYRLWITRLGGKLK